MAETRRRGAYVGVATVLALCAALLACSSRQQEILNEREYAQYRTPGTATITGQVTHALSDGQTLYGADCQVRLTPITTESTRYMNDVVMRGGTKDWSPDADALWWLEQADQQGRFEFQDVPAGSYYLTCPVAWREPDGATRERILWAETTVGPGDRVEVSVSR